MSLYVGLRFVHLLGVAVFLFGHGVAAGASFMLRRPVPETSRQVLRLSQRSAFVANPALLVVLASGIWMGFLGSLWGRGWIWASIAVLVLVIAAMFYVARQYYLARDAPDEAGVMDRLRHTRPLLAAWIGGVGLVALIYLMVFKPF